MNSKTNLAKDFGTFFSRMAPWPRRTADKQSWPHEPPARIKAVESALSYAERPQTITGIAKQFSRVREKDVAEILETLVTLRPRPPGRPARHIRALNHDGIRADPVTHAQDGRRASGKAVERRKR